MLRKQLTKLLDLVGNCRLECDHIALAEEGRQSFTSFAMDFNTGSSAHSTGYPQSSQLVLILVPRGRRRGINGVEESNVRDVKLVRGDPDDRSCEADQ
jgi:hypothetical protein